MEKNNSFCQFCQKSILGTYLAKINSIIFLHVKVSPNELNS